MLKYMLNTLQKYLKQTYQYLTVDNSLAGFEIGILFTTISEYLLQKNHEHTRRVEEENTRYLEIQTAQQEETEKHKRFMEQMQEKAEKHKKSMEQMQEKAEKHKRFMEQMEKEKKEFIEQTRKEHCAQLEDFKLEMRNYLRNYLRKTTHRDRECR